MVGALHLVVDANLSVCQIAAQLVEQTAGDDHRFLDDFTGVGVRLRGVDDLLVYIERGSAD